MSNPLIPIGWNIQTVPGSSDTPTTHVIDITPRVEICEHHKKKKHRRSSTSSDSSSSSSSSSTSSSGGDKKHHKTHHHEHHDNKLHRKDKKHKSRHEKHEAKKLHKIEKHERKKAKKEEHRLKKMAKKAKHISGDVVDCGVPIALMSSHAYVPETKEQYEARQKVVRRVLDEETGRYRLIKGDGEVLEEIVSQKRHKEINKQATSGDGNFFEKKTLGKLSR